MDIKPSQKIQGTKIEEDKREEVKKIQPAVPNQVSDSYEEVTWGDPHKGISASELEKKPDEITNTLLNKQVLTARFEPPTSKKGSEKTLAEKGSGKTPPAESDQTNSEDSTRADWIRSQGQQSTRPIHERGLIHIETSLIADHLVGAYEEDSTQDRTPGIGKTPPVVPEKTLEEKRIGKKAPVVPEKTLAEKRIGKRPPVESDPNSEDSTRADWIRSQGQQFTRPVHERRVIDMEGLPGIGDSLVDQTPFEDSSQSSAPVEYQNLENTEDASTRAELQKRFESGRKLLDDEANRTPGQKRKP